MAHISLTLGIITLITLIVSMVPIVGLILSLPCLAVGLSLSGVALYRSKKRGEGIGMSVAGIAMNIGAAVVFLALSNAVKPQPGP